MFTQHSVFTSTIAAMLFCTQTFAIVTLGDCKQQEKKFEKGNVILQSKDGKCVTIVNFGKYKGIDVVKQSDIIKTMIEDFPGKQNMLIPLPAVGDRALEDIANIMVDIFDKSADEKTQIIKSQLPKSNADQLLNIILAANYLDIGPDEENPQHDRLLLNIGLDLFAQKIFVTDLEKLKTWNENAYRIYKMAYFKKLPNELVKLLIERNLRSIDRVRLNDPKDRRKDAIDRLDLATAQIVAYVAKYNIASADKLRPELKEELNRKDMAKYILFGPLTKAIWPTRCPLPGNPNYDVSVGPHPDARYVYSKDGETVKDQCTNLIWEQSPSRSKFDWTKAESHCAKLRKGNFDDWRLPNNFELESIVDKTKSPTINGSAFPKTPSELFWSSSVDLVSFSDGKKIGYEVLDDCLARCVR